MRGEIKADLAAMPVANMAVLFIGISILLVITAVVIVVIVRKLGIKSFGPFKMEHDNAETMFYMNNKNENIDDLCQRQMRYITDRMKIYISNIFLGMNICIPARVSISSAIRFPLFESISNNHFTTELMPDRYNVYRNRIIDNMRDEYVSLATANENEHCNRDTLPPWEQMSDQLIGCIDLWLKRVSKEVMDACEKKITVYREYLYKFEESKDTFRVGIIKRCVEKNERYIRELKRLI